MLRLRSFLLACSAFISLTFAVATFPLCAAEPEDRALQTKIAGLIEQLGAEEFADRESASNELIGIGYPALAAIEAALDHEDREIRYRASRIAKELRPLATERLLERFLSGDKAGPRLPGWDRFQKQFGEDQKSRALFAEMYKYGRYRLTLLDERKVHSPAEKVAGEPYFDDDDEDLAEHPELTRRPKVNVSLQPVKGTNRLPLGWVAVRVFIAGEPEAAKDRLLLREAVAACFEASWFEALDGEASGELVRRLTARLIPLQAKDQPIVLALGARFGLRETLPFAIEALKEEPVKQPAYVLYPLAAFGEPSHQPLIEPLLANMHPVKSSSNDTMEIQVRDIALATILTINKQPLRDFFPKRKKELPDDPLEILSATGAIGFVNEGQRETTHKKWWASTMREPPPMKRKKQDIERVRAAAGEDEEREEADFAADPFDPFK